MKKIDPELKSLSDEIAGIVDMSDMEAAKQGGEAIKKILDAEGDKLMNHVSPPESEPAAVEEPEPVPAPKPVPEVPAVEPVLAKPKACVDDCDESPIATAKAKEALAKDDDVEADKAEAVMEKVQAKAEEVAKTD